MLALFSAQKRIETWRRLWLELARAERNLGLSITEDQLREIEEHLDDIDFRRAAELEKELRHDVMAHVHLLGELAPSARGILHLGATSCFVTDNADLVIMREGFDLLLPKLAGVLQQASEFAKAHRSTPTLGFTHFQAAQPTTVGKRACLWIQDLLFDFEGLGRVRNSLRFRGVKGTTGTQASFMTLFGGDGDKVQALDQAVTEAFGFERSYSVTGQTYPRRVDYDILGALSGFGVTSHRIGTDLRLLSHLQEVEEPWGEKQIGSSAMPYKRNPMRSERICALARHLMLLVQDAAQTAAVQWLERTLDDSANRRISIPEAFLAADAILEVLLDVTRGLVVNEPVIGRRLDQVLPFLATEEILMRMVQTGADRQEIHEALRQHALAAGGHFRETGSNDLIARLEADPTFAPIHGKFDPLLDARRHIGRAPDQVTAFIRTEVEPALAGAAIDLGRGLKV
jgi:adenylosuccinate lyase